MVHGGQQVTFQWIPGHVNIEGNTRADVLAKQGREGTNRPPGYENRHIPITLASSLNAVQKILNDEQVAKPATNVAGFATC